MDFTIEEKENLKNIGNCSQNFKKISIIGKGSFASVFKVESLIDGNIYVMKIFNFKPNGVADNNIIKSYKKEVSILKSLNHQNIVKYY